MSLKKDPTIIGIAGRARHGKDTLAGYLVRHHGFHQLAFADPIVDGIIAMLDVPVEYRTIRKEEVIPALGFSYRKAAQTLGTEWGRNLIDPDLWVKVMCNRIAEMADVNDRIVISDVRFENEAAWIRSVPDGHLWHVVRPDAPAIDREHHASEFGVEPAFAEPVLMNHGETPDAMFEQASRHLAAIGLLG
jgi:hypothetical protein